MAHFPSTPSHLPFIQMRLQLFVVQGLTVVLSWRLLIGSGGLSAEDAAVLLWHVSASGGEFLAVFLKRTKGTGYIYNPDSDHILIPI